jgi:hypothetical protein
MKIKVKKFYKNNNKKKLKKLNLYKAMMKMMIVKQ